jgi:hypothetical protein
VARPNSEFQIPNSKFRKKMQSIIDASAFELRNLEFGIWNLPPATLLTPQDLVCYQPCATIESVVSRPYALPQVRLSGR